MVVVFIILDWIFVLMNTSDYHDILQPHLKEGIGHCWLTLFNKNLIIGTLSPLILQRTFSKLRFF